MTDVNGNFTFSNVGPGTYKVREVTQAGWLRTTTNPGDITTASNTNVSGINFGNYQYATISGMKFNDLNGNGVQDETEPGLPGWTILLTKNSQSDGNTVTDSTGHYSFTNLGPGTYTVNEQTQSGWTQTYGDSGYTVTAMSGTDRKSDV